MEHYSCWSLRFKKELSERPRSPIIREKVEKKRSSSPKKVIIETT